MPVLRSAGGAEQAGGGEDRVPGVVGVLGAVAVAVDAEGFPARREELHPSFGFRRGDAEVRAKAGLDPVDPCEDRRSFLSQPVLRRRLLVDRDQAFRHLRAERPDGFRSAAARRGAEHHRDREQDADQGRRATRAAGRAEASARGERGVSRPPRHPQLGGEIVTTRQREPCFRTRKPTENGGERPSPISTTPASAAPCGRRVTARARG